MTPLVSAIQYVGKLGSTCLVHAVRPPLTSLIVTGNDANFSFSNTTAFWESFPRRHTTYTESRENKGSKLTMQ